MKKPIVITLLLLSFGLLVQAQDVKPAHAQPDSVIKIIPAEVGTHTAYLYSIGGKLQTPQDIQIKLLAYAPSATEFRAAKSSAIWSWVSFGGFAVTGAAAGIEYANHNKMAGETTGIVDGKAVFIYQHHSLTGAYVFTGIASAFLISSVVNFIEAAKHGKRALNVYNAQYE